MSGEIVEVNAQGKATFVRGGTSSLLPIADFPSPEMATVMHVPKTSELIKQLERSAIPVSAVSVPGRLTRNAEERVKYRRSYFSTAPIVEFAAAKSASIRDFYRTKQLGNSEYRRYFFDTLAMKVGDKLRPLPSCVQEVAGTGFAVVAPVQCGKASLADAIERCLPKPFTVKNVPTEALDEINVFPIIRLKWPRSRTLRGLIKDLRAAILETVSDETTKRTALAEMLEDESGDIAIATCILVNVGGIIVEGATFRKYDHKHTEDILEFLVQTRYKAGIPVTLMCTPAFMHAVKFYSETYATIFDGIPLHLDPLETSAAKAVLQAAYKNSKRAPPPEADEATPFVKGFWDNGPATKGKRMPKWLPQFVVDFCFGRQGWVAQCMEQLDIELSSADAISPSQLSREYLEDVFDYRLKAMRPILKVLREHEETGVISSRAMFQSCADFLPNAAFEVPRQEAWFTMLSTGKKVSNDLIES